jgi:hypothetical protein
MDAAGQHRLRQQDRRQNEDASRLKQVYAWPLAKPLRFHPCSPTQFATELEQFNDDLKRSMDAPISCYFNAKRRGRNRFEVSRVHSAS